MKRNPFISDGDYDNSSCGKNPRKKLNKQGKEIFMFKYSINVKNNKKHEHSIFFSEKTLENPIVGSIWDRKIASVLIEVQENHSFIIPPFNGNFDDAKLYCERTISYYKTTKKILRESLYKKKRKKREKKLPQKDIDNKNILSAIELRKQGFGYDYISKKTFLSISKIKNAFYKESLGLRPFIVGKGAPAKLNNDHLKYLLQILKNGNNGNQIFSYKELLEKLIGEFNEFRSNPPSLNTVIKYTKRKLRFSKKKGSKRFIDGNSEKYKLMRKELVLKVLSLNNTNKEFIYIDETRFNIDMTTNEGVSAINKKFLIKKSNKGENITAICAISKKKLVGLQLFKGGVKGLDFGCFLINLINNNEAIRLNLNKYVFFMDNCPIHKSKQLKKLLEKINIFFYVPYSCDLNPIENVFGIVKNKFKILNCNKDKGVETKIIESFKYLSSINIEWCVLHSYNYYLKVLNMEEI